MTTFRLWCLYHYLVHAFTLQQYILVECIHNINLHSGFDDPQHIYHANMPVVEGVLSK
jgi:hypothetical protein